jgi:phosphatidylinositol alpha-1,6-mannosyltransferase
VLSKSHYVHVLCNQDYASEAEIQAYTSGLPVGITVERFIDRSVRFATPKRVLQAFRLVKNTKPSAVYVTGRFPLWVGALLKMRFPKLFVAGFAHGTEVSKAGGIRGKLTHLAAKKLNHMYAVSAFTAAFLREDGVTNLSILPNGLDASFLESSQIKQEDYGWQGVPRLLTVGNVTPRKGQHRIVAALPALRSAFPTLHYHMVGLPSAQPNVQALAEQLDVANALTFHGRLPSKADLMRAYASADVFIMLSENQLNGDVEGFGIAILEANAFGIPAIGAKGCGIEDAISEDSGILVDGNNPQKITEALTKIMANYAHYSRGARAWAEKHNWEEIVKDLVVSF